MRGRRQRGRGLCLEAAPRCHDHTNIRLIDAAARGTTLTLPGAGGGRLPLREKAVERDVAG
jgi:hypothetical protein